jgi:thymidylate kinase
VIVVIEGVDGTGKSTLVTRLVEKFMASADRKDIHVYRYGPPPFNPETGEHRSRQASDDLRRVFQHSYSGNVIVDRWTWGCPVYGPIFRPELDIDGYGELGEDRFNGLERMLDIAGGRTVWLDAPQDVLSDRLAARGDWLLSDDIDRRMDQVSKLRARYAWLAPKTPTYAGTFQLLDPSDTDALATHIVSGGLAK